MRYIRIGYFLITLLLCLIMPSKIFAHSVLLNESPAPSSVLASSPEKIELTFNERLEKELFYIKVLDANGKSVTTNKTQMSQDQRQIRLPLPPLQDGLYTVSYKIISADAHPVGASYVFTIGKLQESSTTQQNLGLQIGGALSSDISFTQILLFTSRFLFYLCLLSLCGWIFWSLVFPPDSKEIVQFNHRVSLKLQCIFLISLILMIFAQLQELLNDWEMKNLALLLLRTNVGYSWILSIGLSLLGFMFLFRSRLFSVLWIILLVAAKVGNGHAMSFEGNFDMAIVDWVHLFAASIWVGGLIYLLAHRRKYQEFTHAFLPRFSKYALISMLILTLSGTIYTLSIVLKIEYLLYTQWGFLLLIKIALVLVVFAVGGLLRYWMKQKKSASIKQLIRVDVTLMALILIIVGVFTYLNPMPVNIPLYWHEESKTITMTTQITPNIPGNNTFSVQIYMPEKLSKPRIVQLRLIYQDDSSIAPIEVPLKDSKEDIDKTVYGGFVPFTYTFEGPYLPFPGKWDVEVIVEDIDDVETKFNHEMMLF